ncbi:ras and Rab interactor 2 [Sardina pilchardus]|uniref:ras and Rab interactor 2 n=1 Tax=Sardina pilchardus TaxID=27697 RepID=UPI002E0F6354
MQTDPVYDFPDAQPVGERRACPQRGSLKSISVLDRLLLTHPVWLQLSINSATALHVLQREPPGTFLVRKSSTSQKKVLCVRLADDSVPSFVKQFVIREEDSTFSLESSAIRFPDLCRLIAFYCVSRDVLPFTLELPEAIARASSHKQLESISHMGVEFWSSQLNFRGPRNGPQPAADVPPPPLPALRPEDCITPIENPTLFEEFCPIRTRSPRELDIGTGQGALCFINPLFLQDEPSRSALHRRNRFKRSIKVRVSTENTSMLSPPVAPPPPPPLLAKKKGKGVRQKATAVVDEAKDEAKDRPKESAAAPEEVSDYRAPTLPLPKKTRALVPPTLSPTAEEDDYQMPKALLENCGQRREEEEEEEEEGEEEEEEEEELSEDAGLVLEQRRAPSLSELESSSSLSSLDEAEEAERPPMSRGTSAPAAPLPSPPPQPPQPVSALRKMSAAFVSFFMPEKRVARMVEELSRDRRLAFGGLVQDFLRQQRESLKLRKATSAVEMLQGIRHFLSQAKAFLQDCGELEPPIETLLPEDEKDQALEKAMFRSVLKPLKGQIDGALCALHDRDGSTQRLAESLKKARKSSPLELFGVQVNVPDAQGVEKVRQKLITLQRAYSPIDKVLLLLQVCKLIYKAMNKDKRKEFGADDFLPALSYVIVQCNLPELLIEVEYMMELLDTPWLTGEGGYYLTSVYASLCLIQSEPTTPPASGLTREARESLKQWSHRRSNDSKRGNTLQQRFVKVLFQNEESSLVKTLQWKKGVNVEALAQLCAAKFGISEPEDYSLFWRKDGEAEPLSPDSKIDDFLALSGNRSPLIYQLQNPDAKSRKLTRGGAVDLVESV